MTKTTPGLCRLRKAANAEQIRTAVLADQQTGRAEALAKIEAGKGEAAIDIPNVLGRASAPTPAAAPSAPTNAARPSTARPAKPRAAIQPTPVREPAELMEGMSRANANLYMLAARGVMPTPPDFSKPSYACDRKRLAELIALAEAGDADALRACSIRVFYSAAQALDRYRHTAILAIEARARTAAAA